MSTVLHELWKTHIVPLEKKKQNSTDITRLLTRMEMARSAVNETLSDHQREFFDTYLACVRQYMNHTSEDAFCEGFRLATKLMAETYCDKDHPLSTP